MSGNLFDSDSEVTAPRLAPCAICNRDASAEIWAHPMCSKHSAAWFAEPAFEHDRIEAQVPKVLWPPDRINEETCKRYGELTARWVKAQKTRAA